MKSGGGSEVPVCSSGNCDISGRISTETLIDLDCNLVRNNSETQADTDRGGVISQIVGWDQFYSSRRHLGLSLSSLMQSLISSFTVWTGLN